MLPSVGYFKSIVCPFLEDGVCERPYCQFLHDLPASGTTGRNSVKKIGELPPGPSSQSSSLLDTQVSQSLAIEQIVSEAVKRVLKENEELLGNVDAAKILEMVGQQQLVQKVVGNLAPVQNLTDVQQNHSLQTQQAKMKAHKIYSIPAGVPAYTPTPLAVLKKSKPDGVKAENYVPSNNSILTNSTTSYEPSKVSFKYEETYKPCTSSTSSNPAKVDYQPSSRDADNIIRDQYTPASNLDCSVDYQPTNRELSSSEPSYSPMCTSKSGVKYSPSNITQLSSEPAYSPFQKSDTVQVSYTPSNVATPLSPEKYLAMLETEKEEIPNKEDKKNIKEKSSSTKRSSSSSHRHKESKSRTGRSDNDSSKSRNRGKDGKEKKHRDERKRSDKDKPKEHHSSSKRKDSSLPSASKSRSSVLESEESDSDVDEECYRIFQEYQATTTSKAEGDVKKRKPENSNATISEAIIPTKKQRVAHGSSGDSAALLPAAPARPSAPKALPKLSPSMVMIDRFKKLQTAALASTVASTVSAARASSSSASPSTSTTVTTSASDKRRIAHVPNVTSLLTSKPRLPIASSTCPKLGATVNTSTAINQTTAKTALSKPNFPRATSLPRPTITVEFGCRVPANVRQRYLNIFVDEMLKIYDRDEDAFERALTEEKQCYDRSSSKTVYLNVVVNTVNRLRREAESAGSKSTSGDGTSTSGDRKTVSHSTILAGKGGASVSWSIEKPRTLKSIDSSLLSGAPLYKLLERYVMTLEQQEFNGYPRPDPVFKGRAMISMANKFRAKPNLNLGADQRLCDRCGTVYQVDAKGLAIKSDTECLYHWGRPFQRRGEKRYSCCQGDSTSDGCCVGKWHVSDTLGPETMKGFVATLSKGAPVDGHHGVFALDCEMCYTTEGPELTRVTVVGSDRRTVYETLVKPDNPILDHNTRFSGITEEDLIGVRTTIRDVQAVLLNQFSDKTILIGHSFDSDLRALRMIHNTVIDTSLVFPHPRGPPYKKALRTLCGEILQKIIQNEVGGHDSAEDAVACLDLMMWRIKQDLKMLK